MYLMKIDDIKGNNAALHGDEPLLRCMYDVYYGSVVLYNSSAEFSVLILLINFV